MEGVSSNSPEKTKQMGGKRTAKKKITFRELRAEMTMICEEQRRLREGQREVQQKFEEIESQISLMREEGNSVGRPALFSKYK
ncbi:hypothetical protein CRYUN_Cryun39dG0073400 [Craigia yunnanensis]